MKKCRECKKNLERVSGVVELAFSNSDFDREGNLTINDYDIIDEKITSITCENCGHPLNTDIIKSWDFV